MRRSVVLLPILRGRESTDRKTDTDLLGGLLSLRGHGGGRGNPSGSEDMQNVHMRGGAPDALLAPPVSTVGLPAIHRRPPSIFAGPGKQNYAGVGLDEDVVLKDKRFLGDARSVALQKRIRA